MTFYRLIFFAHYNWNWYREVLPILVKEYGMVFFPKIVLTFCEKKIVLVFEKKIEIRGWWPRIFKILENTKNNLIYLNSERSEHFLKQNAYLTYSWRFLISNILEQLEFRLEKIIGI